MTPASPETSERTASIAAAREATRTILDASFTNPATIIKAPPGAGKSTTCSMIVALHETRGHRIAVATPTRAQGHDLATTIAERFPHITVRWIGKNGPESIPAVTNAQLPEGPHVAIGTVARWAYHPDDGYDLLVVDEAFQVTDTAFAKIAHLADRTILMGDPGQIAPVVTVNVNEWSAEADSPVAPAPLALLHRHPQTPVIELPATWRFGPDTARIISNGFYDWSWDSNRPAGHLVCPGNPVLEQLANEVEVVAAQLPHATGLPRADRQLAQTIADMTAHAREHATVIASDGSERPIGDIYVVAAHIDQVAAVRAATSHIAGVVVDTAERLQGRQADLVFAWHPASGAQTVSEFQRDAGRLCVMLSRHKYGAVLVYREGTLEAPIAVSSRTLAPNVNIVRRSVRAQRSLQAVLHDRTVTVTGDPQDTTTTPSHLGVTP